MDALMFVLILMGVTALAVILDIALIRGLQRRREGLPFLDVQRSFSPRLTRLKQTRAAVFSTELCHATRDILNDIKQNEIQLLRLFMLTATVIFSASLGYAHRHAVMVEGSSGPGCYASSWR
jgi:hypothetical protein